MKFRPSTFRHMLNILSRHLWHILPTSTPTLGLVIRLKNITMVPWIDGVGVAYDIDGRKNVDVRHLLTSHLAEVAAWSFAKTKLKSESSLATWILRMERGRVVDLGPFSGKWWPEVSRKSWSKKQWPSWKTAMCTGQYNITSILKHQTPQISPPDLQSKNLYSRRCYGKLLEEVVISTEFL